MSSKKLRRKSNYFFPNIYDCHQFRLLVCKKGAIASWPVLPMPFSKVEKVPRLNPAVAHQVSAMIIYGEGEQKSFRWQLFVTLPSR
jgi:hypothetical protein